ncbi:MAG: hypothetical protein PHV40_00525 [Candidatus Omnitrophica bacterium]|nr:hypothetical protein [Candidatus Omnitrophota bacterium]MDD5500172.1 hypothetical protein [Candidatus Omnitrophota bacterium]
MKTIRIAALSFIFSVSCLTWLYAKDIVVLYTGNTHAMLYTCSCPVEKDGGVARRATLIKQMRRKYPDLLLLDCGSFTAGGLMDEYTQNTGLDMSRSMVNIRAMEMMRYDAVAVSGDEFNFGKDFFLRNARKSDPAFLSFNLESEKVEPYIIKEVSGVKIGIIGLTNPAAYQKSEGLKVSYPRGAGQLVKRLKSEGVNVVIVLSTMDKKDDLSLISEAGDGIDVFFMGHNPSREDSESKIGPVFIIRPSWQGRQLGKLTLKVENGKLSGCRNEEIRLSEKIADDPQILEILPRCYSGTDCKKDGLNGTCKDPGTSASECVFTKPNKLKLTVITARDCVVCDTEHVLEMLRKQFPGIKAEYLDVRQANALVKELSINTLPAYIVGREVEQEKNFGSFKDNLEAKGGVYLLKPQVSGISYFLNRQKEKNKFDVFLSLFDNDASELLAVIKEFSPDLHFLAVKKGKGFNAKNGSFELEECLRGVCIQKYYPDKFWDYLSCRAGNLGSSWWDDCLPGVDALKIKKCAKGPEGARLLRENIALNEELQIGFNLSYLLDNYQIFSSRGVPSKESLRKIIKK